MSSLELEELPVNTTLTQLHIHQSPIPNFRVTASWIARMFPNVSSITRATYINGTGLPGTEKARWDELLAMLVLEQRKQRHDS